MLWLPHKRDVKILMRSFITIFPFLVFKILCYTITHPYSIYTYFLSSVTLYVWSLSYLPHWTRRIPWIKKWKGLCVDFFGQLWKPNQSPVIYFWILTYDSINRDKFWRVICSIYKQRSVLGSSFTCIWTEVSSG